MKKRNLTKLWALLTEAEKHRAKTEGLFSVDVVVGANAERLKLLGLEQKHVDACKWVYGLGSDRPRYFDSGMNERESPPDNYHNDLHNMNATVCEFLGVKVRSGYPVAWQYVIFPDNVKGKLGAKRWKSSNSLHFSLNPRKTSLATAKHSRGFISQTPSLNRVERGLSDT